MNFSHEEIKEIFDNFDYKGEIIKHSPLGNGHINDTFLIETKEGAKTHKYVLQRINNYVFKDVDKLMSNAVAVTKHLKTKKACQADERCMTYLQSKDEEYYIMYKGKYFRSYHYIDDVVCIQNVDNKDLYYESAVAFGNFQLDLADFDVSTLYDTIPNFHNTVDRFNNFVTAIDNNFASRKDSASEIIDYYLSKQKYVSIILDEIAKGNVLERVTHNDTKINNVLLDDKTFKGVCVIDLDTVMKGSMLYDFGDSIRSGISSASEDSVDKQVRLDYYEAFAKGFLSKVKPVATKTEIDLLPLSGLIMTLECGIRFVTDYLDGDKYFKVNDEQHNLRRAMAHKVLVDELEKNMLSMEKIIKLI